jgi:hypothetical protein
MDYLRLVSVSLCLSLALAGCSDDTHADTGGSPSQGGAPAEGGGGAAPAVGGGGSGPEASVCGNDVCELDETCERCEADCGKCASWCVSWASCSPFSENGCPAEDQTCDVAYTGDLNGDKLGCWLTLGAPTNQQLGQPCDNVSFGEIAFCGAGLVCVDPTPTADNDIYDARCRKACCDDDVCDDGDSCKKLNLEGAGIIGYCQ